MIDYVVVGFVLREKWRWVKIDGEPYVIDTTSRGQGR